MAEAEKNHLYGTHLYGILSTTMEHDPKAVKYKTVDGLPFLASNNYWTEWGFESFAILDTQRRALIAGTSKTPIKARRIESGMLLTIFNTISKGEELWSGTVDLEWQRRHRPYPMNPQHGQQEVFGMWVHGFQKDLSPEDWASMFFNHLPSKLVKKDGTVVYGALLPFFETGTEGVIWSLHEYDKDGYEGLHSLENGDKLTIYKSVSEGNIVWQGAVKFEADTDTLRPLKSGDWLKAKRSFNDVAAKKIEQAFFSHAPVRITLDNPRQKP